MRIIEPLRRAPYTVALVLLGLLIGLIPGHPHFALSPGLILYAFLPPLLFAGAWTLPLDELRQSRLLVIVMATVGVAIGIAIAYWLLTIGAGVSAPSALIFGAAVAATDPLAALALLRASGVPSRLATILEGESLFNDATAVVAFRAILVGALAGAGTIAVAPLSLGITALELTAGGALVGITLGFMAYALMSVARSLAVEVVLSVAVAYGSFAVAEGFGFSGVVAVLCAGLMLANVGRFHGEYTALRQAVNSFWEVAAFAANAGLFLLIGLAIDIARLVAVWGAVLWGIAAVVLARAVISYLLVPLLDRRPVFGERHLLMLGGMRGALSMALVLSLPVGLKDRDLLAAMVFGVVLLTLVVQGLSLRPVARALAEGAQAAATGE